VTFDSRGRIVTVCVGLDGPRLLLMDPQTLDLTGAVPLGDKVISALPDWSGRYWFASSKGVMGTVDPANGAVKSLPLGEDISNSFAVDNPGGVYAVTQQAMYRLERRR
jgi:streptogramin lyase